MHHVVLERWSRRASPLHARDARTKLAAALIFLVALATTTPRQIPAFAAYFALLLAAIVLARLPLGGVLSRAAAVLPFSLVFAAVTWLAGDSPRAAALIARSYISACAVLLLVAVTPLPELLRALEWFRVPRLLILIAQFLYRYLFVLSEQAQHMRMAARCRSGRRQRRGFQAAAGALSVLFARSYERASGVHHAMLARGFTGHFPALTPAPAGAADALFLAIAIAAAVGIRVSV